MAGVDAGERLPCPSCGEIVLLKAMIPVLGQDGHGVRYVCVSCARAFVVQSAGAQVGSPEADESADEDTAEMSHPGGT